MNSYLEKGYLNLDDITIPSVDRRAKGPVAVIECVQEIPCNPCQDACPRGAITIPGSINNIPRIDFATCNGCAICVANCPGLAIFVVDETYAEDRALVGMPYEFLPLPEKGEEVSLLDRSGAPIGVGIVERVRNAKAQDRTPIVFLSMERELSMLVRFFRRIDL